MIDYKQPIGKVLSIKMSRDKLELVIKFNSDIPRSKISKWLYFLELNGVKLSYD